MAYSQQVIEDAYEAFKEARTVDGVASLMDIPRPTVHKWCVKYSWKERLEQDLQKMSEDPFGEGALVAKRFDFSEEDKETLKNARIIEGVCLACIREKKVRDPENENRVIYENPIIENLGLKPRSFVEATNSLDKCWKARESILSRNINKDKSGALNGDEPKENYVEEMKRLAQKTQKV